MKLKQRALALMLSMMMVLTFMPALAFADSTASEVAQVDFDMYMDSILQVNSDGLLFPGTPSVEVTYEDGHTEYPWIEIKDVAFADSSFGTIEYYEDEEDDGYSGWLAHPVKTGNADIEFTFVYGNDPTKEFEYKYTKNVTIVKMIEKLYIRTESGDRRVIPGDTAVLHAYASYEAEDEQRLPEDLTYEWILEEDAVEAGCTIIGNGADAEIVIPENYEGGDIDYKVIAYEGNDPCTASTEYLDVRDEIYKVFYDGLNEELFPGESVTITPVVKYRSKTDKAWKTISKYEDYDIDVDVFTQFYDEEAEELIERAYESDTLKITNNGDGSFTLTRKKPGYTYITIEATYTDSDGEVNSVDEDSIQLEYYEYDVELDCDENLYNGGSLTTYARCNKSGDFEYEFKVYKITGLAPDEEGDIGYAYEEMNNSGNKYFTSNGNEVTLNGTALWNELKDGYISPDSDTPQIKLEVNLKLKGYTVAKDSTHVIIFDAGKSYGDLGDGRSLLLGHVTEYLIDEEENTGYIYDADHPYGEEFSYTITKVVSSNPNVIKVYKENSEAWAVEAVSVGTATVTFTVKDEYGETGQVTATFKAVTDEYEIELIKGSGRALPGESVILEAEGEHNNYKVDEPLNDFSFKWVIEDGEKYVDSIEKLTDNGSKIKVNIKKDISAEELEDYIEIFGFVYIVDKNGNVQEDVSEEFDVEVTDGYNIYKPAEEDVPSRPDVNETVEFKPQIFRRSLVDGKPHDEERTGFVWTVQYDQEELAICDSSGNDVLPNEYYYEEEEDPAFNEGNFTVKRLSPEYCSFTIYFYEYDEEMDDYYEIGGADYDFESFRMIEEADVYKVSNKTYTGKAITQSPVVEYWDGKLTVNKDYKISYKNNKNVGTATVIITGIGDYRGKQSVPFKINPKGTALSKVTAGSKSFTAIWKKQATQTTGYQIQYGLKSNFKGAKTATVKKNKTVKTTIKKLKSKKTYYVRIRTYKTVSGKNYYSSWSKAKKVKVK